MRSSRGTTDTRFTSRIDKKDEPHMNVNSCAPSRVSIIAKGEQILNCDGPPKESLASNACYGTDGFDRCGTQKPRTASVFTRATEWFKGLLNKRWPGTPTKPPSGFDPSKFGYDPNRKPIDIKMQPSTTFDPSKFGCDPNRKPIDIKMQPSTTFDPSKFGYDPNRKPIDIKMQPTPFDPSKFGYDPNRAPVDIKIKG